MIKKMMSYIKGGSPNVDLILKKSEMKPGETVTGSFHVENGWNRQEIKRLECDLVKELQGDKVVTVDSVTTILMSETMEAKEKTEYPFSYRLPEDLPPTTEGLTYRLNTRLVLESDIKRNDHDEIVVLG